MRSLLPILLVIAVVALTLLFFPADRQPAIPTSANPPIADDRQPTHESAANGKLIQEAEQYLDDITKKGDVVLDAKDVSDFVTQEQTISLGDSSRIETLSLQELAASGIDANAAITHIKPRQQIVYKTPSEILLDAEGDKNQTVQYLVDGKMVESKVTELLEQHSLDELDTLAVIVETEDYVITTLNELNNDSNIDKQQPLKIITQPYRLPTASIGELLNSSGELPKDGIYYVRNITESDQSGIWGILQEGLLKNFAQGIAIKRGENIENYQVLIPENADEQLADRSSSFLGRLIYDKSQQSHVYNVEKGKMGRNPDLIYPGQEIVIIQFTADELIKIYQHFVTQANS